MSHKSKSVYTTGANTCPCGVVHKRDSMWCKECARKRKIECDNEHEKHGEADGHS